MKKSNVIIFAVLALISIFLLWLWYYLGFNRIDEPLDLVLSIIWWLVIAVAVVVVVRVERERRRRIRTVYVADDVVFNSEAGSLSYDGSGQLISVIEGVLDDLKYNFSKEDLPNKNAFPIKFIVRTAEHNDNTWKGEVVNVETRQTNAFADKDQLFEMLSSSQVYQRGTESAEATFRASAPETASGNQG